MREKYTNTFSSTPALETKEHEGNTELAVIDEALLSNIGKYTKESDYVAKEIVSWETKMI